MFDKLYAMGTYVCMQNGSRNIWKKLMIMEGQLTHLGEVNAEAGHLGAKPKFDPNDIPLPDQNKPYIWKFQRSDMYQARNRMQNDNDKMVLEQWLKKYQESAKKGEPISADPQMKEQMRQMFFDRPAVIKSFLEKKNLENL